MSYCRILNDSQEQNSDSSDVEEESCDHGVTCSSECQIIKGSLADEVFYAVGYKRSTFRQFVFHLVGLFSLGTIHLVTYWRPDWKVLLVGRRSTLRLAEALILKDVDGVVYVVRVVTDDMADLPKKYDFNAGSDNVRRVMRYFYFQYMKYVWNVRKGEFQCLVGLGKDTLIQSLLQDYRGYDRKEQSLRERMYGKNLVTIEVKSYLKLIFTEIVNPFYIFQIASLILWCSDQYYLYAFCIFIISCLSIFISLLETRRQSENLKSMVDASNASTVCVLRAPNDMEPVEIDASSVVPGDVIVIPSTGGIMACDAVLILGTAIVNESMLTGESVPVTKVPVSVSEESEAYSPDQHKRHTLFCGTNVIQTRYYGKEQVLAVVVRTGFSTAKGELVRSILYPRSIDFKFYSDSMKFIGLLFGASLIGMAYSIYVHIIKAKPIMTTVIRTLDIVTIVVPPALPAAMTVGTYYAQNRLKKLGIYCISPPRINISGKIKLFCFDKTGTLTEDGLEVWGVVGTEKNGESGLSMGKPNHSVHLLDPRGPFAAALASCHSLTRIGGELTGDPLDISMFDAIKWELLEPEKDAENFDSLIPTLVRPSTKLLHVPSNIEISCMKSMKSSHDVDCDLAPLLEFDDDRTEKYDTQLKGIDVLADAHEMKGAKEELQENEFFRLDGSSRYSCDERTRSLTIEQVPYEIGIVRQFPFSSSLQRMSVIVRVLGDPHMDLYCKGAPEVVQLLCKPESS